MTPPSPAIPDHNNILLRQNLMQTPPLAGGGLFKLLNTWVIRANEVCVASAFSGAA
jgi:hypothetical protein